MSTKIEWTGVTWNFLAGCDKISRGCAHCYALRDAIRLSRNPHPAISGRYLPTVDLERRQWSGVVTIDKARLALPLKWRKPRLVVVNSLSDLFHDEVPFETIAAAFGVMAATPRHTYQILTKRPARMREFFAWLDDRAAAGGLLYPHDSQQWRTMRLCFAAAQCLGIPVTDSGHSWPLPNAWLGVSVEDQQRADERIPLLLQCPAAVHWLSCEPLLGPMALRLPRACKARVGWVVAGGESGPRARPSHPDWFRSLRDQCVQAGVPFFFQQWGAWSPTAPATAQQRLVHLDGRIRAQDYQTPADDGWRAMGRVGKKAAGRVLDGRTWEEMP